MVAGSGTLRNAVELQPGIGVLREQHLERCQRLVEEQRIGQRIVGRGQTIDAEQAVEQRRKIAQHLPIVLARHRIDGRDEVAGAARHRRQRRRTGRVLSLRVEHAERDRGGRAGRVRAHRRALGRAGSQHRALHAGAAAVVDHRLEIAGADLAGRVLCPVPRVLRRLLRVVAQLGHIRHADHPVARQVVVDDVRDPGIHQRRSAEPVEVQQVAEPIRRLDGRGRRGQRGHGLVGRQRAIGDRRSDLVVDRGDQRLALPLRGLRRRFVRHLAARLSTVAWIRTPWMNSTVTQGLFMVAGAIGEPIVPPYDWPCASAGCSGASETSQRNPGECCERSTASWPFLLAP